MTKLPERHPMKSFVILTALFLYLPAAHAQASLRQSVVTKACGNDQVDFDVQIENAPQSNLQPEPGKALVYVISQVWSSVKVGMDSGWVGANKGHSYISFSADPGEHHLCGDWKKGGGSKGRKISLTSFLAEPGKVYFLRARMVPTWKGDLRGSNGFDLELINPDQGEFLLESLPHSTSHPKKQIP
jgi:hypothetical protein